MYRQTLAQWQVKQCVLSESYRAHRLLADRVLDDGNFSRYRFLPLSESYVAASRVVEDFMFSEIKVKIMKVKDIKKQEKPIALSPNISSLEDETKSPSILICNEKKNQIFYMLWQYKLDKNFDLTFEENRSLLSSRYASKC